MTINSLLDKFIDMKDQIKLLDENNSGEFYANIAK